MFNTSTAPIIIDGYQVSSYTRGQSIVLAEESGVQLGLPYKRLGIGEISEVNSHFHII